MARDGATRGAEGALFRAKRCRRRDANIRVFPGRHHAERPARDPRQIAAHLARMDDSLLVVKEEEDRSADFGRVDARR